MPDIIEYSNEGYKGVMSYGSWKVAFLNYARRFDENHFVKLERHLCTDEVFVLLFGEATLVCGESKERIPMKQGYIYNVRKGEWHHIFVKEGTKVLIVENADTSPANTEYMFFDEKEI